MTLKELIERFMNEALFDKSESDAERCTLIALDMVIEALDKMDFSEHRQTIQTLAMQAQLVELIEHYQNLKKELTQ